MPRAPSTLSFVLLSACLAVFAVADADAASIFPSSGLELIVGEPARIPVPGIQRFLIGDPSLVSAEIVGGALRMTPIAAGRTYLIVWTTTGRETTSLRVLPMRPIAPPPEETKKSTVEHADTMKVGYTTEYEYTRRGQTWSRTGEDTTNRFVHTLTPHMDTPYGQFSSLFQYDRVNDLHDLTTWWTRLNNAHLGPLRDFDAIAGDTSLPSIGSGFAVQSTGYRGGTMTYRGGTPWTVTGLWGQERTGIYGIPTSAFSQERASYMTGTYLSYLDPTKPWSMKGAALFGYGSERTPVQSDQVIDLVNTVKLLEPWSVENELAFSERSVGYTIGTAWNRPQHYAKLTYRDIPEDFETIIGPGVDQGERGVLFDSNWALTQQLSLHGRVDWYKNRLFPNPAEPDVTNLDTDVYADWRPWTNTGVSAYLSRYHDLGLSSPHDDFRIGTSLTQRLPMRWLLHAGKDPYLTTRYEHASGRTVSLPDLDFSTEIIGANLSQPLFWGFTANVGEEWHFLKETHTGNTSQPRRFTTGVNHVSTFRDGRVQLRGQVDYEKESGVVSTRSFLAGQDRIQYGAGVTYRPTPNQEWHTDGYIEHVKFETGQAPHVEFSILSGARMLFDTRVVRWDPAMMIGGMVFHDVNGDRVRQPGEPGLQGVRVTAGPGRETVTNRDGRFAFGRIRAKSVPVAVDLASLPEGFVLSTDPTQVVESSHGPVMPLLFGALGRGEIRGRVFYDVDGDGRYSEADQGLDGVKLTLDGHSALTDHSGWFYFRDLSGGTYTLTVVLESVPLRYIPRVPLRQVIELPEGGSQTIDLPMTVRRVLQGQVFIDHNGNRTFDVDERPIVGMPVCLDGRLAVSTDEQGRYRFAEIGTGQHRVLLNCGMPLKGVLPLSSTRPLITIRPQDPDTITVDFLLDAEGALLEKLKPARPKLSMPEDDVTGL